MTMTRDCPPIGLAQNSLFPYEIASNYTRDLEKWEIEKQNEELVGHNTLVLSGELDSYASDKTKSATFRFWVDKDTGILLKYETYNSSGEVVHYLHPKKLVINQKVDPKKHKPDLSKYKRE
jgi:outer membrane lipoprotein-sorting protein